ncbi:hypothetical protein B566_EDAN007705 [Ephemera danica]|nr:hypothetical protein B566_EDAN007705 [Ephemera danica]
MNTQRITVNHWERMEQRLRLRCILSQTPAVATKPAASPVAPAVVSVPASSPAVVATALQESARKFPVAAPRSFTSREPLQTGKIDHPRPEKPPPPILDKPSLPIPQQRPLSIHEKRNSFEKPDRPPKPELLMGSAALLPTRGQVSKPPRPQPPPPPPPAVKQRIGLAPLASESTDL